MLMLSVILPALLWPSKVSVIEPMPTKTTHSPSCQLSFTDWRLEISRELMDVCKKNHSAYFVNSKNRF